MNARLYVIPASHPSIAAQLMLEHKGISYKRTDLLPVISKGVLRAVGFPGDTVPALKIDGDKVQGSRPIARELDRLRPEPPLLPADPEQRAAVEEAERFGDEELQHPIRQILWWGIKKDREPLRSLLRGSPPRRAARPADEDRGAGRRPLGPLQRSQRRERPPGPGGTAGPARQGRRPGSRAASLNGEQLNAADFQIAPSIGLAMTLDDLRPAIENRPAAELARRLVPNYPGKMPPVLPAEWLAPLRAEDTPLSQ